MKAAFLLFTILSTLLFGCLNPVRKKNVKERIEFGDDIPTDMSLLWRIDGKNLKSPSYLFGTMHLIQEDYWLFPESLENRIKNADKVVLEIANVPSPQESLEFMTLKEGSFFDFFDDTQTDSIYTFLEQKLGFQKELVNLSFSKMKPFAIAQLATLQQFGQDAKSYELTINTVANENNIETIGLETASEQIALFDNLTKKEQAEMVMQVIRNYENYEAELNEMQAIYQRQRIDSLYYLVKLEADQLGPTEAQLLDERNQNWIPKIKKIIKKNKSFIAVGAAHLYGEEGIIERLKKENYIVTPINL